MFRPRPEAWGVLIWFHDPPPYFLPGHPDHQQSLAASPNPPPAIAKARSLQASCYVLLKKSLYKNPEESCVHYQSRNGNCAANGVPAETSQLLTLLDRVTHRCAVPDKTLNSSVLLTGRRSRLSCFRLDLLDCAGVSVCERTEWSNKTVSTVPSNKLLIKLEVVRAGEAGIEKKLLPAPAKLEK